MDNSFITARASFFNDSFKQYNDDDIFKSPLPVSKLDSPNNFRRESLGILHEDFGNVSFTDFGRESMKPKTMRESLLGKESLGILNLNDISLKNDLPEINVSDLGKESLGIINFKNIEPYNDIILNTSNNNSDFNSNVFNKGFLTLPTDRMSVLSSVSSSTSVCPLFDVRGLEGISKIYSASSIINSNDKTNLFNVALSDTNEFMKNLNNSMKEEEVRQRIQSLPIHFEDENVDSKENDVFESPKQKTPPKFFSCQANRKSKFVKRNSFHGVLDFDDSDNVFYESFLIESRHLAEKIADGSIYDSGDQFNLENTLPPPLVENSLENSPKKSDTEKVLERIDIIASTAVPLEDLKVRTKSRNQSTDSNQSNVSRISNISDKSNGLSKSRRSNNSNSSNAKELLQNLSEILTSQNRSNGQQAEGRKLLSSLADILTQSPNNNKSFEDSGHSSICENQDLSEEKSPKILTNIENIEKTSVAPKNATSKMATPKKGKENSPACTVDGKLSKQILRKNSNVGPVKPKPLTKAAGPAIKGPLKAVIPITNMVKKKSFLNPKEV